MGVYRRAGCFVATAFVLLAFAVSLRGQTAETGQITGTVWDPSKASIPNATVTVTGGPTGLVRTVATSASGDYTVTLLPPGIYSVTITASGFKTQKNENLTVQVATVTTLNLTLQIGESSQQVSVEANAEVLQTQDSTNGGTTTGKTVSDLPLTNRNYTQILGLNPGVASPVSNAASLGKNNVDVNVNGSRVMDNSYQMDGQDLSNLETQGTTNTVSIGGISVPSPDAIQEFKVQTSLYDAAYGRGSGANVDVVTKSGSDSIHGDIFEFNRNNIFNANDFFLNRTGQPRADMKQNQFGGTVGGPIIKRKLFYFGSYQGTRQVDGEGAASLESVILPPITNDRSAAALGSEFCGQAGKNGGVAVACDGSNINPIALQLLNYKLPNGQYFIPTPQIIQPNGTGLSVFSIPSFYSENQYMANVDYAVSDKQQISEKFFWAKSPQVQSFTTSNVPGSGIDALFRNVNTALKDTYSVTSNLVNEASAGYHRTYGIIATNTPVTAADLDITPPCNLLVMPTITVQGSFELGGSGNDLQDTVSQTFAAQDQISWVHDKHDIRAGFGWERVSNPTADPGTTRGSLTFQSFPDFLLGMSAAQNGSAFSNLYSSSGACGDTNHSYRVTDENSYVQDDYKVTPHLTLNVGIRWDIFGAVSDALGRLVNFYPALAPANPGPTPSLQGFVVAHNFPFSVPAGVTVNGNNTYSDNSRAWNNFGPRLGFSWQPGHLKRAVIRGGFGIYYSRTSVNDAFHLFSNSPFYSSRANSGVLNAAATFQDPFNPAPPPISAYPVWVPRTSTTALSITSVNPDFRAPDADQWSLNTQVALTDSMVLQVGYVGTRGENIQVTQSLNQPYLASPSDPINGITANTIQNAAQRVPYVGFSPTGLSYWTEAGHSMYNALQTMLTKRMGHGLQLQASYTYGKALTDVTGNGTFPNGGSLLNDNRNFAQDWGPADFDIRQRFVTNFLWTLPRAFEGKGVFGRVLSDWSVSGVIVIQTGPPITFTDSRSGSIYGFSNQRAQLCPGMTAANVMTSGSVQSRLDDFFNAAAFCAPTPVGNGFGFGDTGRGIVYGPGQHNADLALEKEIPVKGFTEQSHLVFRTEFYNALNTPQFASTTTVQGATPPSQVGSLNFGQITSTSVSPRLIQFGLKYIF
jgi:Carboxypeptidase regulatory-like domain